MSDWPAFSNRLNKNWKHISKWAKRQGLSCFRLYDKDIPAFPLIIDWYQGHVHIQEYDTGWQQTVSEHQEWLVNVQQNIAQTLNIPTEYLHCKYRQRQRGLTQYEKIMPGQERIVEEQGHRFWVNLDAYLDTGLFLDHRPTRRQIEIEAAGKRFLNLFCYTGAFTVYAGAGGAVASESVDLSNTYLDWAKRNLLLNHLDVTQHKLIRADVFAYLQTSSAKFDLIVLDPPSFSNSTKMHGILGI